MGMKLMLETSLPRDPRTARLALALGVSAMEALGHVVAFKLWVLEVRENGHLDDVTPAEIAQGVGWTGDGSREVDALVAAGFVERDPELCIPDWVPSQGRLIEKREADRVRQQRRRDRLKASRVTRVTRRRDGRDKHVVGKGTDKDGTGDAAKPVTQGSPKGAAAAPHHIPDELKDLRLYAADRKLCDAWHILKPDWSTAFPGVDLMAEIRKAHAWEASNPARSKKDRKAFLNRWLSKAQDQRGGQDGRHGATSGGNGGGARTSRPAAGLNACAPGANSLGSDINKYFRGPEEGGPK